jgi:hypothetical protein
MPIPQSRPPRSGVFSLVILGLLLTSQLSFGYRGRWWLSASDPQVSFGGRAVGSSATMPETLTNVGGYPVTLNSANLAGSGFTLSGPSFPLTLGPGESVTLEVIFSPAAGSDYSGTLAVSWGRYGRTLNLAVTGTGTGTGSVSAVPASLSFGNVTVGASLTKTASLSASGSSIVISAVNTTNPEFTITGLTLPVTVNSGQSVPFTVKFSPQSAGAANGNLSFVTETPGSVASQTLSGSGSVPAAADHSVALSWVDSTTDVAGYNVYRGSSPGGPYTRVNASVDADNAYSDSSVASGTTYFYVVTSVNDAGAESGYSSEVTAAVPTP